MTEVLSIKKKKYNLLNAFRLIAAFSVITIHVHFPGTFGTVMIDLARYAVPFFFMVSGFFSYYTDSTYALSKIKAKIKNISIIYIGAAALYSAYKLITMGTMYIKRVFSLMAIAEFFLFNMPESSEHLWFLPALVYTYIVFYFFEKLKITKKMYFLIPLLLLIGITAKEIFINFGYPLETLKNGYIYRNFFVLGIPFFMLGHLIKANEEKLKSKLSNPVLITVFFAGLAESVVVGHLHAQKNIYLGTIISVFALFIFVIKNEENIRMPHIASIGEKYSLYIYVIHLMLRNEVYKYLENTNIILETALPMLILIASVIISAIYLSAKTNIKNLIKKKKS